MPLMPREAALVSLRELCPPAPPRFVRSMLASAAVLGIAVTAVLPRAIHTCGGGSRTALAQLAVDRVAYELYPQWALEHPDRTCPMTLRELPDVRDTTDPWGTPVVFTCSSHRFAVRSAGEDGRFGTSDDIASDR
jgi:hypothetical protein